MSEGTNEYTTTERVAKLAWHLAKGETFTTQKAAELTEMSHSGAWLLLQKLCRVLPITYDDSLGYHLGYWYSIEHYNNH